MAAKYGHIHIMEILCEFGAKVNAATGNGSHNALHIGVLENHAMVVEFLMKNGCDKNLADEDGFTPLHKAIQLGNGRMIETLLSTGAQVKFSS